MCGLLMMQCAKWIRLACDLAPEPDVWLLTGRRTKVKAHFISPLWLTFLHSPTSIYYRDAHKTRSHVISILSGQRASVRTRQSGLRVPRPSRLISCSLNHVNCFWRGRPSLDGGSSALCPTSTAALKYSSPEPHTSQAPAGRPARAAVLLSDHRGFPKPPPSRGHGDELHTCKYRGQHSFDLIYLSKYVWVFF